MSESPFGNVPKIVRTEMVRHLSIVRSLRHLPSNACFRHVVRTPLQNPEIQERREHIYGMQQQQFTQFQYSETRL